MVDASPSFAHLPKGGSTMSSTKPRPRMTLAPAPGASGEAAVRAANEYMLLHYVIGLLGGTPYHLSLRDEELWIVPMVLTSPAYGAIGEVGSVAVDAHTGNIVGGTAKAEVIAAIRRLREAKHDAIQAAFLQARKG
jgi:hypothetical protein